MIHRRQLLSVGSEPRTISIPRKAILEIAPVVEETFRISIVSIIQDRMAGKKPRANGFHMVTFVHEGSRSTLEVFIPGTEG
jgi:hypothetical protein